MSRRPKWYSSEDARADRAAKYGTNPDAPGERPGGVLAHFDGFCWICDRQIVRGVTLVAKRKGSWPCAECAGAGE